MRKTKKNVFFSYKNVWIFFDFLLLLRESEDADLEEEAVEDDLRLLLFLALCLLLD